MMPGDGPADPPTTSGGEYTERLEADIKRLQAIVQEIANIATDPAFESDELPTAGEQYVHALKTIERLQDERDEFQRRLTFIQDGHDPFAEIEQLQAEIPNLKRRVAELTGDTWAE